LSLARKLLHQIRLLHHEGTQKPEWTKSLRQPALVLFAMLVFSSIVVYWK
jgi:hypothetical protein